VSESGEHACISSLEKIFMKIEIPYEAFDGTWTRGKL
jgi:hypothetical protein